MRVHAVPACGSLRLPAVSGASDGWRWWEERVRSGAESPDDRLLNLEGCGELVSGATGTCGPGTEGPTAPRHPLDLVGDRLCLHRGQRHPDPWAGGHDL